MSFSAFIADTIRRIRPEMWFFMVLHICSIQLMKHWQFDWLLIESWRLCGFAVIFVVALSQAMASRDDF